MSRASKPVSKNSNSRFTTRNNKQDIFSKFTKATKPKNETKTETTDDCKKNPELSDK